jgi:hypothetical protein
MVPRLVWSRTSTRFIPCASLWPSAENTPSACWTPARRSSARAAVLGIALFVAPRLYGSGSAGAPPQPQWAAPNGVPPEKHSHGNCYWDACIRSFSELSEACRCQV